MEKESNKNSFNNTKKELSKDELYYYENGFLVFKEAFHLQRGYCCGNGCRHCPYKKKN
ncbi:MAG: hypothetical protein K9I36_11995 [Bacteroidia bacterium]|nr:hypothetical protein [Bacteroidia bacterium]MCF8427447.1 hypothetical protein [Bacteroidia bacterium]